MRKFLGIVLLLFVLVSPSACKGAAESNNLSSTVLDPIPHVGAAHETQGIVFALDLPIANWQVRSIQIGADHGGFGYGEYTLTIFYEPHSNFQGEITESIAEAFFENTADRLFDLIGNLQAITFSVNYTRTVGDEINDYDYRFSITRSGAKQITPVRSVPAEELIIDIDAAAD